MRHEPTQLPRIQPARFPDPVDQVWLTGLAYLEPGADASLLRERLRDKRRAGRRRMQASRVRERRQLEWR